MCRFPRRPPPNISSVVSSRGAERSCREAEQHCSFSPLKGSCQCSRAAWRSALCPGRPPPTHTNTQHLHKGRQIVVLVVAIVTTVSLNSAAAGERRGMDVYLLEKVMLIVKVSSLYSWNSLLIASTNTGCSAFKNITIL